MEYDFTLTCGRTIDATLTVPPGGGPFPVALILGGTLASDKDGNLIDEGGRRIARRPALHRIARILSACGWASIRYARWGNIDRFWSYDMEEAIRVWKWALERPEVDPRLTLMVGESAGAYLACLMARAGIKASASIFLGALHGSMWDCFVYNCERVKSYAARGEEEQAWVLANAAEALAMAHEYPRLFQAAEAGIDPYRWAWNGLECSFGTQRLQDELRWPPASLFGHIEGRVLALHGENDLNVPPSDLEAIGASLKVKSPVLKVIPGLDHSFQITPESPDLRIRERITLASFKNPFGYRQEAEMIDFLKTL